MMYLISSIERHRTQFRIPADWTTAKHEIHKYMLVFRNGVPQVKDVDYFIYNGFVRTYDTLVPGDRLVILSLHRSKPKPLRRVHDKIVPLDSGMAGKSIMRVTSVMEEAFPGRPISFIYMFNVPGPIEGKETVIRGAPSRTTELPDLFHSKLSFRTRHVLVFVNARLLRPEKHYREGISNQETNNNEMRDTITITEPLPEQMNRVTAVVIEPLV